MTGATRILVTGASGCIGAATVRTLLDRGADAVVAASASGAPGALHLWGDAAADRRVRLVRVDVGDAASTEALVLATEPTAIVHLAALQSPACDADPEAGLRVDVGGTLHVLRAAERSPGVRRLVFASSAAVYGVRSRYPGATVRESDPLLPPNLYGVWKLASEQLARQFAERTGIPTVCLRLNTTYGKGRDRGRTAAPTAALQAIALGAVQGRTRPFRMPYHGREHYHFVEDVAAHFAECTLAPFDGFGVFNLRGETVEVREFLARARRAAEAIGLGAHADLGVAPDAEPNPFVCDLDDRAVRARFPGVPCTPLEEGIERTLAAFLELARAGRLADPG